MKNIPLPSYALENYPEIYWEMLGYPTQTIDHYTTIHTGINNPWLNGILGYQKEKHTPESIKQIATYFIQKNIPFSWWVKEQQAPSNFSEEVKKYHLARIGDFTTLYLNLEKIPKTSRPNHYEIEIVKDQKTFSTFVDILLNAYDATHQLKNPLYELYCKNFGSPSIVHLLGKEKGIPVSTGSIYIKDNHASIYNVATIHEARNKGLSSFLMTRLLEEAKNRNNKFAALASTPASFNMYQNLGFETHITFQLYTHIK